mgnify:CR=1 FL=1
MSHPDHVGTPREIYNLSQQLVWRRPHQEPFGDSPPDENPSGLGTFEFPLGESLYYGDKETGNRYAMFRDAYNPAIGAFPQSDPIGLLGGLNTYAYAKSSPLKFIDPDGLRVQQCCRPAEILSGAVEHCWLKTDTITAGMASSPQCRANVGNVYEPPYSTDVYISDYSCEVGATCVDIPWEVDEDCVNRQMKIGTYLGKFTGLNNCQTFANEVLNKCTKVKPPRSPQRRQQPPNQCCKK